VTDKPTAAAHIEKIADEITRYLHQHQFAADTLEGICNWWIRHQPGEDDKQGVLAALEYLLAHGQIHSRQLPDGSILYSGTANCDLNPNEPLH
jgi:hypothetical protein